MRDTTEARTTTPWDALSAALDADGSGGALDIDEQVDIETLVAYHRGRLDVRESHQLQQRLAMSPALVAELLDLEAFATPMANSHPMATGAELDIDQAWGTFESRLDRSETARENELPRASAPIVDLVARRQLRPAHGWWVAAAAMVLAIIGLRAMAPTAPTDRPMNQDSKTTLLVASFEKGAVDTDWKAVPGAPAHDADSLFAASFEREALDREWTTSTASGLERPERPLLRSDFEPENDGDGWTVVTASNTEV